MDVRIKVVVVDDDGQEHQHEIATLTRGAACLENVGVTLAESKQMLQALQQILVTQQATAALAQQRACPHCGQPRPLKESGTAPFRTLFGRVEVPNPRWQHCACQPHAQGTFRPLTALLPERTSPELIFLETSWAADASHGSATKHLHDAFPLDDRHRAATVRNHTLQAAQRAEQSLGPERLQFLDDAGSDQDELSLPDGPLAVGLDGGLVRGRSSGTGPKAAPLFELLAGKSILAFRRDDPEDVPPSSKCFALVRSVDPKPKRRLYELLCSQGLQANQQVTFFSDGGDNVRAIPEYLNPESEHVLDWFHATMSLTVLRQCARGLAREQAGEATDERTLERRVESVKHYLWHGNVTSVLEGLDDLEMDLEIWDCDEEGDPQPQPDSTEAARMLKYVRELQTYVANNARYIVNYGERYRNGERISTGFVESTINYVVSKRILKKQQMHWTPQGAHLLLQVRTRVLNGEWEQTFRTWYPGFRPVPATDLDAA
jgi:hypothetical protein